MEVYYAKGVPCGASSIQRWFAVSRIIRKIQEHQVLLNSRYIELISKNIGTKNISEDDEFKEHIEGLKQTYSEMMKSHLNNKRVLQWTLRDK